MRRCNGEALGSGSKPSDRQVGTVDVVYMSDRQLLIHETDAERNSNGVAQPVAVRAVSAEVKRQVDAIVAFIHNQGKEPVWNWRNGTDRGSEEIRLGNWLHRLRIRKGRALGSGTRPSDRRLGPGDVSYMNLIQEAIAESNSNGVAQPVAAIPDLAVVQPVAVRVDVARCLKRPARCPYLCVKRHVATINTKREQKLDDVIKWMKTYVEGS